MNARNRLVPGPGRCGRRGGCSVAGLGVTPDPHRHRDRGGGGRGRGSVWESKPPWSCVAVELGTQPFGVDRAVVVQRLCFLSNVRTQVHRLLSGGGLPGKRRQIHLGKRLHVAVPLTHDITQRRTDTHHSASGRNSRCRTSWAVFDHDTVQGFTRSCSHA